MNSLDAARNGKKAGLHSGHPHTHAVPEHLQKSRGVVCGRLTGTLPDVGIPVPGIDPVLFPYLGLGGDLFSDLCEYSDSLHILCCCHGMLG